MPRKRAPPKAPGPQTNRRDLVSTNLRLCITQMLNKSPPENHRIFPGHFTPWMFFNASMIFLTPQYYKICLPNPNLCRVPRSALEILQHTLSVRSAGWPFPHISVRNLPSRRNPWDWESVLCSTRLSRKGTSASKRNQ